MFQNWNPVQVYCPRLDCRHPGVFCLLGLGYLLFLDRMHQIKGSDPDWSYKCHETLGKLADNLLANSFPSDYEPWLWYALMELRHITIRESGQGPSKESWIWKELHHRLADVPHMDVVYPTPLDEVCKLLKFVGPEHSFQKHMLLLQLAVMVRSVDKDGVDRGTKRVVGRARNHLRQYGPKHSAIECIFA